MRTARACWVDAVLYGLAPLEYLAVWDGVLYRVKHVP